MENSPLNYLNIAPRFWPRTLVGSALAVFFLATSHAQDILPELQADMPITIDADSSEFDYESSRLIFHGLRIDQGTLGIEADIGETDKLDFTNGMWIFTGNVSVEAETAKLRCDKAQLKFVNHQLVEATLTGGPARFEQFLPDSEESNTGEARVIVYKLTEGTLQLEKDARFSDGSNEISGDLITYDLTARRLTAGAGDSGPVKILIESPSQIKEKVDNP